MDSSADRATYRFRQDAGPTGKPAGFRHTLEVADEHSGRILASCDLVGRAVFGEHAISDHEGRNWNLRANRKVMPSRWLLADPSGSVVTNFDQGIAGKLLNPLHRVALTLVDPREAVAYRLIDPSSTIPDRLFGLGPDEWALMRGDSLAATLLRLGHKGAPPKGLLGKLRTLLTPSDRGLVSAGMAHALPAPVALAMVMLFEELIDVASG